jgi:flagellar hook-length control protein FliK
MPASAASVEAALAALLPRPTDPVSAARADDVDLLHPTDIASAPADPTTGALAAAVARPVTDAGMRIQFAAPIPFPARPELGLDDAFDQRIVWMVDQRITQAEMRVNPEGVGPIDVRLQVEGQRVTAQFNAANADVRQALEAGMDRLRDLLGQRGMELGDAQVGQQRSHGHRAPAAGRGTGDAGADDASVVTTVRTLRARGLVDEYA